MAATGSSDGAFASFKVSVEEIAKEEVNAILVDQTFTGEAMHGWTTDICAAVMGRLAELKKPFKFVATCSILQRKGAGFSCNSQCLWDATVDGSVTVRWENASMYAIMTVYALSV